MTDDETLFRAPRLTRLEIQGFKSFLNRTVFAFEPGIIAVVGPNGSGKSNVADAVRWVLGEQGQHALRARKTEEVIFSGGQGRAPAGMAEATLTFDNSEGWLPIEFTEVSVTRRAFRSGENQYLINGRKVRLKDVALLTAGLGQSHVVVGQGLVDAALSLRADERRGLFEHAADLTGLRLTVAEAERNLTETEGNTARLHDLLIELEPRLKTLERAAKQAKEWQGLRDRLRALQGVHYRAELAAAGGDADTAQAGLAAAAAALAAARDEAGRLTAAGERAVAKLVAARATLAAHDERRAALEERQRRQTHERDLAAARIEALGKRRADMEDARTSLDDRVASVASELAKLETELRDLARATHDAREATARHGRAVAERRDARRAIEADLAAATRALAESERNEADLLRRGAVLGAREESLAAEEQRLGEAIAERAQRIAVLDADVATVEAAAAADHERAAALEARLATSTAAVATTAAEAAAARGEAEGGQRSLSEAQTRLDVLCRLAESGAGLQGGVREVLAAGRDGRLSGILGAVAELVVVPAQLEVAIEVALGSRLQDIVVASWADAEAAITHLKASGAGRATFQPLDTVRGHGGALPAAVGRRQGVLGVAADLVEAPPEVAPVAVALLGRTVVADTLETVRAALPELPPGWSAVTLTGEIARAGGSVTGGAAVRESGTLGRERELRELPGMVESLAARLATARGRATEADDAARAAQDALRQAEGERAALRAAAEERQRQQERQARWVADLRHEQERDERRQHDLGAERGVLAARQREVEREVAALQAARRGTARGREVAEAELAALATAAADLERAAAEEGRRLAGLEERLRGERRREAGLRAQERALAEELALRAERTALLDRERQTLATDHERLTAETAAGGRELAVLHEEREPLQMEAMGAEIASGRLADSLQGQRALLADREREHDHAGFALERAQQELNALRRRIVEDLEIERAEDVLGVEGDEATASSANREAEIARLRERLRRVGYVGEDAVAEYERESTQQQFLREQLADVEGAAARLRQLLADLRQTMRARFDETFARVAAAFAEAFATLFGGGTARLVLAAGENGAEPGIEIIAQPPGKRLQNLSLLSGGERALTAAALLFAILKVNPVPFCLLDEVDAALDEANVVRFRERLQELAAQTQVIVVTHNRGTIEIADTLYGVTMAADGVSQVLSLRLSESLPAD